LAALGNSTPLLTADPRVLEHLQLNLHLKGDARAVTISTGTLILDDSTLTFSARAREFSKPDLDVHMVVDTIDLDRYLPPRKPLDTPAGTVKSPAESPAEPSAAAGAKIDYSPLQRLVVNATLKIGSLVAQRAQFHKVQMAIKGQNGRFSLDPLSLDLYQGTLVSRADLDVTTDTPKIDLTVDAEKIASGALVADVLEKKIIQGQLDATLGITLAGDTLEAIKKSLNGRGNLKFTDGAIIGIDIPGMVRNARASLGLGEKTTTRPRTDFAELMLPFTITSGLVDVTGTALNSPLLRVTAEGTADLVAENLDMRVEPKFVATLKGQGDTRERSGPMVPVLITGTLDKPRFSPDLTSMVQSIVPDGEALKSMIKDGKFDKEAVQKSGEEIKQLFKGFLPFKGDRE
jgi:AsmA protein